MSDEADAKIYKAYDESNGSTLHCGVTQVVGTIEEVAALFKTETTEDAKEYCRRFGNRLLDAVVLYNVKPSSADTPLEKVGISWRAFKSPGGKIILNRDTCVLESHHEFKLGTQRGWVCALTSIEHPCCPDLEQELGLVRMQNYGSGHVVVESKTRPGYLDITYVTHVDVSLGKSEWVLDAVLRQKSWLADISMKKRCRNVAKIDQFLRENRLSQSRLLQCDAMVPVASCRKCFLCQSNFGPWKKRWNCLKCGQVVCTGCSRLWQLVGGDSSRRKPARFCTMCSSAPRTHMPTVIDVKRCNVGGNSNRGRRGQWHPIRDLRNSANSINDATTIASSDSEPPNHDRFVLLAPKQNTAHDVVLTKV
ncbi:hypothetical protein, variant 1 [Aphanomyces invadans]|nr:hypothetical protein, variant 1 [Aphanomyces invadans]ETV96442.1 hypothetical protein, variant 1 [Aphanomyces invadans]|eukprot:XP_008874705.1 hypothetical protein, variant 1 [Aphanomyces invadans]